MATQKSALELEPGIIKVTGEIQLVDFQKSLGNGAFVSIDPSDDYPHTSDVKVSGIVKGTDNTGVVARVYKSGSALGSVINATGVTGTPFFTFTIPMNLVDDDNNPTDFLLRVWKSGARSVRQEISTAPLA